MTTSQLKRLFTQTCSIVAALATTSGEDGRPSLSWTTGATTTTGVACRIAELSMQERAELPSSAVESSHMGYIIWSEAPASLKTATAERTHRITNVLRRSDGSVFDAGPFDVLHIANAGGADHHLELYLSRIG